MPQYKAPLRDVKFLLNEVFDYPGHFAQLSNGGEATPDMVDAILEGCATFCEEILSPINHSGDLEGCHFENGNVTTTPSLFLWNQPANEDNHSPSWDELALAPPN